MEAALLVAEASAHLICCKSFAFNQRQCPEGRERCSWLSAFAEFSVHQGSIILSLQEATWFLLVQYYLVFSPLSPTWCFIAMTVPISDSWTKQKYSGVCRDTDGTRVVDLFLIPKQQYGAPLCILYFGQNIDFCGIINKQCFMFWHHHEWILLTATIHL